MKNYIEEKGDARVKSHVKTSEGFNLGRCVSRRRGEYKKNKLSQSRIKELESLKGWVWSVKR